MPSGPKGRSSGPSPRTCAQLPLRSVRLPRLTSAARSQLKEAGYHTSYSGKYLNQYALPGSPGCAKNGDPIGIQTAAGLYKITGDWASENPDKLAKMMAKQVRVTGKTSEAGGEKLLSVSSIELAD